MEACLGKTGVIESAQKNLWKVKMDDSSDCYTWCAELIELIKGVPKQTLEDEIDFDRPADCVYHPDASEWHSAKIISDIDDEGYYHVQYDDKDSASALGLPERVGRERMCFYKRIFVVRGSDSSSTINIRKNCMFDEGDKDIVGQILQGMQVEVIGDTKKIIYRDKGYLRLQLASGTGWTTLKILDGSYTGLQFVKYSHLDEFPNFIHFALASGSPISIISRLIRSYPENLNDMTDGMSLIHHAIRRNCSRDIIAEIMAGIPKNVFSTKLQTDSCGRTFHHVAAIMNSSKDLVTYLLENFPESYSKRDNIGRLPIHYAVDTVEDIETIKALIDGKSELLLELDHKLQTPIHVALAGKAASSIINLLAITAPAALIIKDNHLKLAIHYAAQSNAIDDDTILCFLDHNPASVHEVDDYGRLPLHYICMRSSTNLALFERFIGLSQVSATKKDKNNRLPLHYAVCSLLEEPIVNYLLGVRIVKHDRWRIESPDLCDDRIFKVMVPTLDANSTLSTYIAFDSSSTPQEADYVTFYRDETRTSFWGHQRYMLNKGLPGLQNNPILHIPTNVLFVHFGKLGFVAGDLVELSEDYATYTDSTGGLLAPVSIRFANIARI